MGFIFEVVDKTGRKIRLTKEQWTHVTSPASPHAYMTNHLEKVKETLINLDKIISSIYNIRKSNYYKYYKEKRRFLRTIVSYLNGEGFVITSYFVRNIVR